jgi:Fe2+ transport system protein FeoA
MIFRFISQDTAKGTSSALARLQRRLTSNPAKAKGTTGNRPRRPGKDTSMNFTPEGVQLIPLSDLSLGQHAVVDEIMLNGPALEQVMLFGFIPGVEVVAGYAGPGGDPRVYRVDGTQVAVRRETACQILVRPLAAGEHA